MNIIERGFIRSGGEAFVEAEAFVHAAAIRIGQQGGRVQIDFGGDAQRCGEVGFFAAFERFDRGVEHVVVQTKTDLGNIARLFFAEDFARATDFHVLHGEKET